MRCGLMALATAFIMLPGRAGFLDGIPLDRPHELLILIIALAMCSFAPMRLPENPEGRKRIYALFCALICLSAAKVAIGTISLPQGLNGSYALAGRIEAERLDRQIMFSDKGYAYGETTFPVWFLNDRERFNQADLDRTEMPFTTEWNGYARMETAQPDMLLEYGGDASVEIDGVPAERFAAWKTGMYPIRIRYDAGTANGRFLRLTRKSDGTAFEDLFPKPYGPRELARDKAVSRVGLAILIFGALAAMLAFMALVSGAAWKEWFVTWRPGALAIGAVCFALLVIRLRVAAQSPHAVMLYSGSDELTYETFARHMRITGDWSMGQLEREAYYYQLYYYFVALMHYIGGEGLMPIFIMQAAMLVVAGLFMMRAGMRMAKCGDGWKRSIPFGAAFAAIGLMPELGRETMRLMPTIPGILAAAIAAWAMLLAGDTPGKKGIAWSLAGGMVLGIGIMNRYNFLVWAPFLVAYAILGKHGSRWAKPLACAGGIMIVLLPFVLRNRIVADQWRLVSQSNTTANFMLGTPVPEGFEPKSPFLTETKPILGTFFDGRANRTIGWMKERPYDYARFVYHKAKQSIDMHPALWSIFGAISLIWIMRPKILSEGLERRAYLLWGGFVIGQFSIITIMSTGDGRYYAPIIPFLVLSVALAAGRSMNSLFHSSKQTDSQMR